MKKLLILASILFVGVVAYKWIFGGYTKVGGEEAITNSIVVDFQDNVSEARIKEIGEKYGVMFRQESKFSAEDKLYVGEVLSGEDEGKIIDELRSDTDEIEAADENMILSLPEKNLQQTW